MHKIVKELEDLIKTNKWKDDFEKAIKNGHSCRAESIKDIKNLKDYLKWLDDLLHWAPRQKGDTRLVYNRIVEFYFFLDQEPVKSLQSPIKPGKKPKALTPLSNWIVRFANAWGDYLDTPASAKEIDSFKNDPLFDWDAYMPPPSGYFTFNQFFARHMKPGMRPIAGLCDNSVIVSQADCTFVGWWQIDERSDIYVQPHKLNIKGIQWSIEELLQGSKYADRFKGGVFCHSFLDSFNFHRWNSPVQGKVLETKNIQGQCYLDVNVVKTKKLYDSEEVILNALDNTGYQFVQTRGLIVIESPIGLVACLPMGMAQVSSVVITAEEGRTLHKGEELGYFQFGGSDFVIVFERDCNVQLTARPGVMYNQGSAIGFAHPYSKSTSL